MTTTTIDDRLVATTTDNERVYVNMRLTDCDRPSTTVEHQPIEKYLSFAASGLIVEGRKRDATGAGQCLDALVGATPVAPFTEADVASLHSIWKAWHLNDTTAGCVHQTKLVYEDSRYGRRIDLDGTTAANDCPAGYKYGHAWLVRVLPDDVVAEIERLIGLLGQAKPYEGN